MENKDNPFIDYYRGMFQKIIHNDDYSTKSAFPIVKNTVTNLLWPCALYRVEVQSSKMLLDVFERTVLGLAECKITTTAEMSSNMKMTPEIIEFIQNRLVSKTLLKPNTFEISEKGTECLQKVLSEQNSEPIVVCILKDLISGRLLDYAEVNPPLNSIKGIFPGKENTPYVRYFLPGNADSKADLVFPESLDIIERNKFTKPEPALILRAIRRFNKFADNEDKIPLNNSSNKAEIKTEEYVLVATSAFATTAGDIYSTDVTGVGISDIYTDFIREANSETNPWLKKIFDNGTVTQDAENEESISDVPRFYYPSVSKPLFETYKKIESIKNVNIKEGVTERQEIQRKGEQIIYDLYSAFEDVMKLHYQNNHDTNEEDSRIRSADEEARMLNKQMLSETESIDSSTVLYYPLAETLGFDLTEQEKQIPILWNELMLLACIMHDDGKSVSEEFIIEKLNQKFEIPQRWQDKELQIFQFGYFIDNAESDIQKKVFAWALNENGDIEYEVCSFKLQILTIALWRNEQLLQEISSERMKLLFDTVSYAVEQEYIQLKALQTKGKKLSNRLLSPLRSHLELLCALIRSRQLGKEYQMLFSPFNPSIKMIISKIEKINTWLKKSEWVNPDSKKELYARQIKFTSSDSDANNSFLDYLLLWLDGEKSTEMPKIESATSDNSEEESTESDEE